MIAREVAAAAADWFVRLQEEDASEQDFQEWQQWLNASPEHRRAYGEIENSWRLIGEVKPAPWAALEALANDPPPDTLIYKRKQATRWQVRGAWALAATVLLVCAVAFSLYWAGGETSVATKIAEQRSVRLSDGSRVILGAESKVTSAFDERSRRVVLDFGEAYFEVARDSKRPFTVISGNSRIRAIGTAFNVRAMQDRIVVTVTNGRVAVEAGAEELLLTAGQQAAITRGGVDKQTETASGAVTWMQGRFEYRGEELRHVVDDLNRYTDRRIILKDESLGALRYSGTVFPDHLDEWLQGIGGVLPIQVRSAGQEREITAR